LTLSVEPEEIIDSCFSNQGCTASAIGADRLRRAASRSSGVMPRTVASTALRAAIWRMAASAIGDFVLRLCLTKRRFPTPEAVLRRALDIAPVGPC
jgi:hypothetical protein